MKCQRDKFQLQRKVAYLNCAYMSPLMKKAENAGRKGISAKRKPFKIEADHFFRDGEQARNLFSNLINSNEPARSVIIPSVSYGISNAANNLPKKKGEILILDQQFPSNVYAWKALKNYTVRIIETPSRKGRGKAWNERILDSINPNTAAVAMANVHWVDGTLFDLRAIRELSLHHGAALVIDGTQSVGALPIDVNDLKPDALICAGYKWLMGPYSIGMAYYGPMFDKGTPIENNWINRRGAENFGGLVNYEDDYMQGSLRYEVGEHSNFILLPMLIASMKQVLKWTPEKIQEYCKDLMSDSIDHLIENGFEIEASEFRANHLFGIRLPKHLKIEEVQQSLIKNRISVSVRGDSIRVSPHVYNDSRDISRFVKSLVELI